MDVYLYRQPSLLQQLDKKTFVDFKQWKLTQKLLKNFQNLVCLSFDSLLLILVDFAVYRDICCIVIVELRGE